ncbi:MAG TPA: hypothetical protein VL200_15405 [Lacunisphaera sp.]|jgi:hypothetical protein|nr:hypothetical protein [Lacunisphaera sp.]
MRPVLLLAAAATLAAMAWLTAGWDTWVGGSFFRGQKQDYYNLLVDGFQEGHLYMKAAVDPGRLSPDLQVRLRSPYLMDASEFAGHYYLYFGVVPAILVLWPYAAITGHDLQQNAVVWLAVAAGFLVSLRLYAAARKRYFPDSPAWADGVAAALLAFATCTPSLLVAGGMYEIAIASGYACTAGLLACLFGALHSGRPSRWLAAASLCFGLAVGCRPTCILLGPVLVAAALMCWRRESGPVCAAWRLGAAVLGPAGVIGLGLMAYNYGRFGNVLEFGLRYQVNALQGTGKPLASAAFIPVNLGWYYFSLPDLTAYFPYVFPLDTSNAPANYFGWEPVHGQWFATILTIGTVVAAGLRARGPGGAVPRPLFQFLCLVAACFLGLVVVTSSFGVRSDRYVVDFQGSLVLFVVLLGGWAFHHRPFPRWFSWWRAGWAGLAGALVFHNVGQALQLLDNFKNVRGDAYRLLAYQGDKPAAWLARLGWHRYGPVHFKVTFSRPQEPVYEALLSTGVPTQKDVLYAAQYPNGYADFILEHEGHGGARSPLMPIQYGRTYEFEVDMGSLYPPADCDYFPGWGDKPREILASFGRVAIDGTEVIKTRQAFYAASPGTLALGAAPGRTERPFSGRISAVRRLPPRTSASLRALMESGVWRVDLDLPPADNLGGQPVLGSGTAGHGNLLFLRNRPDGTFQFGFDTWGVGARYSPPLARTDHSHHRLEIVASRQVVQSAANFLPDLDLRDLAREEPCLRVWLDGQLVWMVRLESFADTYDFVGLGTNTQGFSTTGPLYQAPFKSVPLAPDEMRAVIERNIATAAP